MGDFRTTRQKRRDNNRWEREQREFKKEQEYDRRRQEREERRLVEEARRAGLTQEERDAEDAEAKRKAEKAYANRQWWDKCDYYFKISMGSLICIGVCIVLPTLAIIEATRETTYPDLPFNESSNASMF